MPQTVSTAARCLAGLALLLAQTAHAAPPVFADLTLPAATARAQATDRMLVLVFTADWCLPCKAMDRAVWPEPALATWLADHAVTIQLDLDDHQDLAIDWQISAIPMVIVHDRGVERARSFGYRSAEQLLTWLDGLDEERADHAEHARLARQRLQTALADHNTAQAAIHAIALIDTLPPTADQLAPLYTTVQHLAQADPDARELITAAQQRLAPAARLAPWDHPAPWLVLSRALGDDDAILDWLDRVVPSPGRTPARATAARLADHADLLAPALIAHDRFALLARIRPDPIAWLDRTDAALAAAESIAPQPAPPIATPASVADARSAQLRQLAAIHAGLLALSRPVDAARLRTRARQLMPGVALETALLAAARSAIPDRSRLAALLAGDPLAASLANSP